MWIELIVVGGVLLAVVDVLESSAARDRWAAARDWTPEALIRQGMRGDEAGALRAEFRRSGITPPDQRLPRAFP